MIHFQQVVFQQKLKYHLRTYQVNHIKIQQFTPLKINFKTLSHNLDGYCGCFSLGDGRIGLNSFLMCQAGLTNIENKWENWEWDEDEMEKGDLSKNFFLTMEHFGLSIPFFILSHSQFNFYIFAVFVVLGVGSISGLIILIGEMIIHRIKNKTLKR